MKLGEGSLKEKMVFIERATDQSIPTPWQLFSRLIYRYWFLKYPWQMSKFLGRQSKRLWLWFWLSSCNRSSGLKKVDNSIKNTLEKYGLTLGFFKAAIANPRATGAVLPSSRFLVREMVTHVVQMPERYVVELGAGTGVITQELLSSGVSPGQLIAIEYDKNLARKLAARFPDILVICGNAVELERLLGEKNGCVSTVISGLPLRSLPNQAVVHILQQIPSVLVSGGSYIQFTYDFKKKEEYYPGDIELSLSKKIWLNIPPAKVDVFTK
ncbi:ribosomal RNA adenine dimethylase [Piscirickettsia salmonis]|uniref:16S ribosomal RNA methyltransferase KsgA/Dim1 family protein n=2 Tax=Piscirickettsia salmonis TaxID=1238 RepID=A0A9Q6LUH3_PISSA|nr:methyltransferase domain-containing protein [Piscirickettsia salmonis]ALA24825.1 ribosomal RNA adenine dimethylase family protein [Piscirickettsia salmonis]APS45148.1 ribosomal RNA adenine dimethylase [Piscirickettsia salmonis]APS48508.1 ribosomal RNA adenine dimethylase [Piscirickettsia salmonis]APS49769.1 ribosomal RNA adenine dimethylase [Piscirickettsia salmonis]APS52953.1 ribosomal RNA adenine dimethylase [Piscirickettsia salmonis]